jgi:ABC-2 type transport system ATP-binding protein
MRGFSSGERQRLGIAQAQINYPELLILDEPAASLDPIGRHELLEIMERLRKETTIVYSTHILSDVQRISDAVAILEEGKLVAQASLDDLLAGSGGISYSVAFKGDGRRALSAIASQPWVTSVTTVPGGSGQTTWEIGVNDETVAESRLFRLLADQDVVVIACGRKTYELEEIFLSLVKEQPHD